MYTIAVATILFASEYVQLFRDGRIEAVHSYHFRNDFDDENRIGFRTLYEILRDCFPEYTAFLFDRESGHRFSLLVIYRRGRLCHYNWPTETDRTP